MSSEFSHSEMNPQELETATTEIINLGPTVADKLTMDEIIEKVSRNEQIPGIKRIEAKIHSTSSKSELNPIKKPWEQ